VVVSAWVVSATASAPNAGVTTIVRRKRTIAMEASTKK
jgi:hypothetical protein